MHILIYIFRNCTNAIYYNYGYKLIFGTGVLLMKDVFLFKNIKSRILDSEIFQKHFKINIIINVFELCKIFT